MNQTTKNLQIAFDNAGGATLFGTRYAHHYQNGRELAADVIALLAGADVNGWDGNDAELAKAMKKDGLKGYERGFNLAFVAEVLIDGAVSVNEDQVCVNASVIGGYTEAKFWAAVSAR